MTRLAVFAYGSLVDPRSASLTLGREVSSPLPARLVGWRRRWTVYRDNRKSEKTFAIQPGGEVPPWIIGLNIEPDPDDVGPAGALLEVTEAELDRLDLREMRYERTDVTAAVAPLEGDPTAEIPFDRVIGFTARPEHHAPEPPPGAVIIAAYLRTVEAAFLSRDMLYAFRGTTAPPPVPVVDGELLPGDEIPAGNPRDW
jgi:hypothetical protein